jgi:hypothetical protein
VLVRYCFVEFYNLLTTSSSNSDRDKTNRPSLPDLMSEVTFYREQIGWVEGYEKLPRDNGTLVYTQTKEKATWQRAGFQKRTKRQKRKEIWEKTTNEEPEFQNPTPTSHTQDRQLPT